MSPGLDPRDERALATLIEDLRQQHGEALRAVLLAGEAAGPEYRPRASPLAVVVVLESLDAAALRRTRSRVAAWRRRRIPAPLLLEAAAIERSLDVFPLELLELRDRHRLLYGRAEAIERLAIALPHLRLELEEQLRGKLLHLVSAYLEAGESPRALRRLLFDSWPGFAVLLRGLLRLRGGEAAPRPADPQELIGAVERELGVELPALRRLDRVRRGQETLRRAQLEPAFEAYLADVRRLERLVDAP
jgi:hypothetical protein